MHKLSLLEALNKMLLLNDLEGMQHMIAFELKKERSDTESIPQGLLEALNGMSKLNDLENIKPLISSLKEELKSISQHLPAHAIWEVSLSTLSNQDLGNMEEVLTYIFENHEYALKFHFKGIVVEMLGQASK